MTSPNVRFAASPTRLQVYQKLLTYREYTVFYAVVVVAPSWKHRSTNNLNGEIVGHYISTTSNASDYFFTHKFTVLLRHFRYGPLFCFVKGTKWLCFNNNRFVFNGSFPCAFYFTIDKNGVIEDRITSRRYHGGMIFIEQNSPVFVSHSVFIIIWQQVNCLPLNFLYRHWLEKILLPINNFLFKIPHDRVNSFPNVCHLKNRHT